MNYKERVQARAIEFAEKINGGFSCSNEETIQMWIEQAIPLAELCIKHEAEAWRDGAINCGNRSNDAIRISLKTNGYIE